VTAADRTRPPLEAQIGRVLTIGTYVSVGLIAVGVALMAVTGRSPLEVAPALDLGRVAGDLLAMQPSGFLWLGLVLVLATPSARVVASLVGYARAGERGMALVSVLILLVIGLGVAAGAVEL